MGQLPNQVLDTAALALTWVNISTVFLLLVPLGLFALGISYLAFRVRNASGEDPDTQVGFKSALYFVYSLGMMMFLVGLTQFVVDLVVAGKWFAEAIDRIQSFDLTQRAACSLMLSGFIFMFFHMLLIYGYTNNHKHPQIGRVWVGWRFALHGLVVLFVTTLLIYTVILLEKASDDPGVKAQLGVLIVWVPSWLLHLVVLSPGRPPRARKRRDGEEEDAPVSPNQPTPQRSPQPATTGQQQQQGGQRQSQQVPTQRPAPTQQRPVQRPVPRKPEE